MNPGTCFNGDTGTCIDGTCTALENVSVYYVYVNGMETIFTVTYKPILELTDTTETEPEPEQVTISLFLHQRRARTRM